MARKAINVDDLLKDLDMSLNEFNEENDAPSPVAVPAVKSMIHEALNSSAPADDEDPYDFLDAYGTEGIATLPRAAPQEAIVPPPLPSVFPVPQQPQQQPAVIMARQQSVGFLQPQQLQQQQQPFGSTPPQVRSPQFPLYPPPESPRQNSQPLLQLQQQHHMARSYSNSGSPISIQQQQQQQQPELLSPSTDIPPQRISTPVRTPVNMARMNSNGGSGRGTPNVQDQGLTGQSFGVRRGSNAQYVPPSPQQQQQRQDCLPSPGASTDFARRGSNATNVTSISNASNDEAQEEVRKLREQLERAKLELIDQLQMNKMLLTQQQQLDTSPPAPSTPTPAPPSVVAGPSPLPAPAPVSKDEFQGVNKPMTPSTKDKGDSSSISSAKSGKSTKSTGSGWFGRSKSQSKKPDPTPEMKAAAAAAAKKKKEASPMPYMAVNPHMMGRF
ncbi:UNVERIFIED_CONTAM: hypothetical protein HDU68_008532 [Siphonaria sp. JEL0065]|nr:hypothetical protein HDU68_008532 [Siphonaria sp. JEL0065]